MIEFSPEAREEIIKILAALEHRDELRVRIGLKGNSCDGSFLFGLDKVFADDETLEIDEIPLVISKKHLMHVVGCKVRVDSKENIPIFTISRA